MHIAIRHKGAPQRDALRRRRLCCRVFAALHIALFVRAGHAAFIKGPDLVEPVGAMLLCVARVRVWHEEHVHGAWLVYEHSRLLLPCHPRRMGWVDGDIGQPDEVYRWVSLIRGRRESRECRSPRTLLGVEHSGCSEGGSSPRRSEHSRSVAKPVADRRCGRVQRAWPHP